MFKGLFNKKDEEKEPFILFPLEGKIVSLEEVPDPVFSKKLMGDGFAIEPSNETVISPIDGEIISIFPTKHAISLKNHSGKEILIHIGLETVNLNGEGFTSFVKDGQKVKKGQKLLKVDFSLIKNKVPSIVTPVIFTNLKENERVVIDEQGVKIE